MHVLTLSISDDLNSSCTVRAGGSAASDLVIQVVMIAESTRLQCMLANYGIQVAGLVLILNMLLYNCEYPDPDPHGGGAGADLAAGGAGQGVHQHGQVRQARPAGPPAQAYR